MLGFPVGFRTSPLKLAAAAMTLVVALVATPRPAEAVPFPVPPSLVGFAGADIDGTGYFSTNGASLALELFDLAALLPPLGGFRFGMYFQGDPLTLIPIFDVLDEPVVQSALIDFTTGIVLDADAGVLQALFAPSATPIGFFLQPIENVGTLYSDRMLNAGGTDVFAAYPSLADPSNFFTTFYTAVPGSGLVPLQISLVTNLTAVSAPPAAALVPLGLLAVGVARTRRRSAAAAA